MRVPLLLLLSIAVSAYALCTDTFVNTRTIQLLGTSSLLKASPYGSAISIPLAYTFATSWVSIRLKGITTSDAQDLTVYVDDPSGDRLYLMDGDSNNNFVSGVNLFFETNATARIAATDLVTGFYLNKRKASPFINMTNLVGITPAGVWRLYVDSSIGATTASILSWEISVSTACPYPALSPPTITKCYRYVPLTVEGVNASIVATAGIPSVDVTANVVGVLGTILDIRALIDGFKTSDPTLTRLAISHLGHVVTLFANVATSIPTAIDITIHDSGLNYPTVGSATADTYHPALGVGSNPASLVYASSSLWANAASFALLAYSTITDAGASVIRGDIGIFPGTSLTGGSTQTVGVQHLGDATASAGMQSAQAIYDAYSALPCTTDLSGLDLGGMVLLPGVYCFSASGANTGHLTLNGSNIVNPLFIFRTVSTFLPGIGSYVTFNGTATSCGVYWIVGSSATVAASKTVPGHIIAHTSITFGNLAHLTGRAVALNGAITLSNSDVGQLCVQTGLDTSPSIFPTSAWASELAVLNGLNPNGAWLIHAEYAGLNASHAGLVVDGIALNFTTDCGVHVAPSLSPDCQVTVDYEVSACSISVANFASYYVPANQPLGVTVTASPSFPAVFGLGATDVILTAKNYYGVDTCEVFAQVFTPGDANPCGTNGDCDVLTCVCHTGFGGDFCCTLTGGTETCGGTLQGACGFGAVCGCLTNFAGDVCCPQLSGQATPCGNSGTCNATADCVCDAGFIGTACSVDDRCPSDDPTTQCSLAGSCQSIIGTHACLPLGAQFVDDAGVNFTVGGEVLLDEGRVALIQNALVNFAIGSKQDLSLVDSYYPCSTVRTASTLDNRNCVLRVMANIVASDAFTALLVVGNYPVSTPGGGTAPAVGSDWGVYNLVTRGVQSFLGIPANDASYSATVTTFVNQCHTDCIGQYVGDRPACLVGCAATVTQNNAKANAAYLKYPDVDGVTATVNATVLTDEGLGYFLERVIHGFGGGVAANQTLIVQLLGLNATGLNRTEHMDFMLDAFIASSTFTHQLASYGIRADLFVNDSLTRLYPELAGTFDSAMLVAAGTTLLTANAEGTATLLIQLLCAQWIFSVNSNELLIGIFPKYQCVCDTTILTVTDSGLNVVAGGIDCSLSCPVGTDGIACSGFHQGVLRGTCEGLDIGSPEVGTCVCGDGWVGEACQFPSADYCYAANETRECGGPTHGACVVSDIDDGTSLSCVCVTGWIGQYCTASFCPGSPLICSADGACAITGDETAPRCHCYVDAELAAKDFFLDPPILPTGLDCSVNGIAECGTFFTAGSALTDAGVWTQCNNQGLCKFNTVTNVTACVCTTGFYGERCVFSFCPDVTCPGNGHSICNATSEECVCNLMWGTAATCADESCQCQKSLCGHGTPDETGLACTCDDNFIKVNHTGACTVAVCPLIMHVAFGERLCTSNDPVCTDDQDSLADACCVQACPGSACSFNETTSLFVCNCTRPYLYDESNGVCYSKCNGQPAIVSDENVVTCNCSQVVQTGHIIWDEFCEVSACLNDGVPSSDHLSCVCPALVSGSRCQIMSCGERGVLNTDLGICDCLPVFFRPLEPTRLSCLIDVVQSIIEDDIFAQSIAALVDDPLVAVTVLGQEFTNENFPSIIKDYLTALGIAVAGPGVVSTVAFADVDLVRSVDDFDVNATILSLAKSIGGIDTCIFTFDCASSVDVGSTAFLLAQAQRAAVAIATSYLIGKCPGTDCEHAVSSLARQTTCILSSNSVVNISQCLLDGDKGLASRIFVPSSPYTDNRKVVTNVTSKCSVVDTFNICGLRTAASASCASGILTGAFSLICNAITTSPSSIPTSGIYEDEGQVEALTTLMTTYFGGYNTALIDEFLNSCTSDDGIGRTACIEATGIELIRSKRFAAALAGKFVDDTSVTVTVGDVDYLREDVVKVMQATNTAYGVGLTDTTSVEFYYGLCGIAVDAVVDQISVCNPNVVACAPPSGIQGFFDIDSPLGCKQQVILSSFTCFNRGCVSGADCQACITAMFTQTACNSNHTGFLGRCLASDAVVSGPVVADFYSTPNTDPAGSVTIGGHIFSDQGQVFLIKSLIKGFRLGSLTNATLINKFYRACPINGETAERSPFCSADNANGGTIVFSEATNDFKVKCESNQLYNAANDTCSLLDCDTADHLDLCAKCIHGQPYVISNQVKCDCTIGSAAGLFSGSYCDVKLCPNGGIAVPADNVDLLQKCLCNHIASVSDDCLTAFCVHNEAINLVTGVCSCAAIFTGDDCSLSNCGDFGTANATTMVCDCPISWTGVHCQTNNCLNGGSAVGAVCECDTGFEGALCETVSVILTKGVSSSSSSSTGGVSLHHRNITLLPPDITLQGKANTVSIVVGLVVGGSAAIVALVLVLRSFAFL